MGSPDRVISERLKVLHDNLYYLYSESAQVHRYADYEADTRLRKAVERALQLCMEASLDIGRHIIALENLPHPDDNQQVFTILAGAGIVPDTLLAALVEMARFRNLIVHEYTKIDDVKVYQIFKVNLSDFDRFVNALEAYFASE